MSDIFNINDYKKKISGLTEKEADVRYINSNTSDVINGTLYAKNLQIFDNGSLIFNDGTSVSSKNDLIPPNTDFIFDALTNTNSTNTKIQINNTFEINTNLGAGSSDSFKITDTLTKNRLLLLPRSGWASYNPISDGDDMTLCYYPDTIDYIRSFNITRWSFTKLGLKFFEKKLEIHGGNSKITMNGETNKVEISGSELNVNCPIVSTSTYNSSALVKTTSNIECNNVIANTINGYTMAQLVNVQQIVVDGVLIGSIVQGLWKTTPSDKYLFCDGSLVSKNLYPELFAVIGYDYGPLYNKEPVGDDWFYLPDLRASFLRGCDVSSINSKYIGKRNDLANSPFGYNIDVLKRHSHSYQKASGSIKVVATENNTNSARDNGNSTDYTSTLLYGNFGSDFDQSNETAPFYHTVKYLIKAKP
jgi:microcystin-dependent protein